MKTVNFSALSKERSILVNLITSGGLLPTVEAAGVQLAPSRRHLVDVLPVLPAGPGIAQVPRLVGAGLTAAAPTEGAAPPDNDAAEYEAVYLPFATVLATIPASRAVLEDGALVAAAIDGDLREALRSKADTALAGHLAEYAPLFPAPSELGFVDALVAGLLAFQKRWGAARAVLIDHTQLAANVGALTAAAPGVVQFAADALLIAGVPVVAANLDEPGQAIITAGTILEREKEAVVSLAEITNGKVWLKATARLAALGPALRVSL